MNDLCRLFGLLLPLLEATKNLLTGDATQQVKIAALLQYTINGNPRFMEIHENKWEM